MAKKDGGPAFPRPFSIDEEPGLRPEIRQAQEGMTLRDFFAAQALVGCTSSAGYRVRWDHVAAECYAAADAMLKARED